MLELSAENGMADGNEGCKKRRAGPTTGQRGTESIMSERSSMRGSWTLGCLLALVVGVNAAAAPQCTARSGASVTPLVELYTSEGCNSCPPADRWLSALKLRSDVVGLAFHVDYWDRLGWKDRFGSPAFTQRPAQQQVVNGARFSFTPQVVIDGQDRKDLPPARVAGAPTTTLAVLPRAPAGARVPARASAAAHA